MHYNKRRAFSKRSPSGSLTPTGKTGVCGAFDSGQTQYKRAQDTRRRASHGGGGKARRFASMLRQSCRLCASARFCLSQTPHEKRNPQLRAAEKFRNPRHCSGKRRAARIFARRPNHANSWENSGIDVNASFSPPQMPRRARRTQGRTPRARERRTSARWPPRSIPATIARREFRPLRRRLSGLYRRR